MIAPPRQVQPAHDGRRPADIAKTALRAYAMSTSFLRPPADFVIIGAKRGGTTSLSFAIAEHPDVRPLFPAVAKVKGTHFLQAEAYRKGESWYRSFFPTRASRTLATLRGRPRPISGEGCPYYLFYPHAPARARVASPDARFIVLLRDPVDRAYSHYRERVRHGAEPLSFEDAIQREPERLAGEVEQMLADPTYASEAHEHHGYVAQGMYADALERWMAVFPRDRFLLILSEDLYADPEAAYARMLAFLGLAPYTPPTFPHHNFHGVEDMLPQTRERLIGVFAPHNRRLSELLGLDLRGWGA